MTESNDFTTRTKINTVQLGLWTGAWVLTTALAAFGPKFFWEFNTPLTILGVLINLGIGFGMILLSFHVKEYRIPGFMKSLFGILFSITNEVSFTIISLSSSDKFFLESWFFIRNYYYITNYHRNLLRFTLYIRS